MGMFFIVLLAIMAMMLGLGVFCFFGSFNPFSMIVAIVAISVFGGVLREFAKHRKDMGSSAQEDLAEIKQKIAQMETDIADIKEQIADFIIKQF